MIDSDLLNHVKRVRRRVIDELLQMQKPGGYWTGELSTSALSTATSVVALEMMRRNGVGVVRDRELPKLIAKGLQWLKENANQDGGWGDTIRSHSNISTTALVRAAFEICSTKKDRDENYWRPTTLDADRWLEAATEGYESLPQAIEERYGKDRTFSVPILMQCALAGLVDWKQIPRLPFELAALPHSFYAFVKLPVVSYALPALIAIGQLLHQKNPTWFLPLRMIRTMTVDSTLEKLTSLQPSHGGFLEAAPLTGFVTMSLAAAGRADHVVARRGAEFLVESVRNDGSWPIDTNLSTWVTTLVINALGDSARDELPNPDDTLQWLLDQQHKTVHPFTQAEPGGWAWTPLEGGVPDADDTSGAIRAILNLRTSDTGPECDKAVAAGFTWLASLQNRDGGIPTFCKGWGTLPFDRSSCDITAHGLAALAALSRAVEQLPAWEADEGAKHPLAVTLQSHQFDHDALTFLKNEQAIDGSWTPLWFGNEELKVEENPVYGTSRVLLGMNSWTSGDTASGNTPPSALLPRRSHAVEYLKQCINKDGGVGGGIGIPSSLEETALAAEALIRVTAEEERQRLAKLPEGEPRVVKAFEKLCIYLVDAIDRDAQRTAIPIGFYFAKLWYYEKLYPYAFALAALQAAVDAFYNGASDLDNSSEAGPSGDATDSNETDKTLPENESPSEH